MAEGADPDDRGSHKNESILRWLKEVKMASQDVPHVSDRGLSSNPAQTSYFAHDLIGVDAAVCTTNPNQSPFSHATPHPITSSYNIMHHPLESPQHSFHKVYLPTRRSQSFSLLSKPLTTASLYRRRPTYEPKTSPMSKPSSRAQAAGGNHSTDFAESNDTVDHPEPERETEIVSMEEKKKVEASAIDNNFSTSVQAISRHSESEETSESRDTMDHLGPKKGREEVLKEEGNEEVIGEDCDQRLQKLRSFTKTRQSSLSPLPVPMVQPSLPTFNLSDVGILPAKHNRLSLTKKMPTVTGVKPGRTGTASKLLRATTSPSELSLTKTKSAPTSPKPLNKESNHKRGGSEISEEKEEKKASFMLPGVLERRKSFSHGDVIQLQQLSQLSVGQVSPVASCDLSNGDAPSTQHSLVVEGGSSNEDNGKKSDDSLGKLDSLPSDEVAVHIRDSSGDSPSHQSASSVDADRGNGDSAEPATNYHSRPDYQFTERQGDQSKVLATSICPISPPSPCTPHSPLVRQHHISRSPSPSYTHTSSVSPFHKSRRSGSNSGIESDTVISKQKLKLHEEGQTFSFDTSDDGDLSKLSRQPKFLLNKTFQPMSSCPLSPPSPSSSHHSSGILSQYLSRHHHCTHSDNTSLYISSPTKLGDVPAKQTSHASKTSSRARSPVLSDQLFLRRGSTPVTLSLMKTTSQAGPPSAKSSYLANTRSSFQSAVPVIRTVTKPSPVTAVKVLSPTKHGDGSKEHPSREYGPGEIKLKVHNQGDSKASEDAYEVQSSACGPDKGPVNRQDSGIGTLSTTSNKCDFRM